MLPTANWTSSWAPAPGSSPARRRAGRPSCAVQRLARAVDGRAALWLGCRDRGACAAARAGQGPARAGPEQLRQRLTLPTRTPPPMKKTLLLPLLAAALALTACGKSGEPSQKLVVAATAVPHAEILEVVKPILKQEGVDLDVRVFNDYVQPNDQLVQKQVDANYFQTEP
ncbi:hypothetical protein G6F63_014149 [Rhizopus arrhizus]|nr:hypothetical protein G6F63_014149 [Rhizopus arrhizus]